MPDKPHDSVPHNMVTTTFELKGYQVATNLGLVRGIVVRSRSVVGTIGASLQTLVGGDILLFTQLCEDTRRDAFAYAAARRGVGCECSRRCPL
jgi:uncharacterized protein YbjQ (UPF0145 family)